MAYRIMRFYVFFKKRVSAKCGSLPRQKAANRTMRFYVFHKKHVSAKCGSPPRQKATNRKMRFTLKKSDSPHFAVARQ
ncbi:MAG: hypothetical protein IKK38_06750 [Spirochaetaceae bacterium]|nr:hypothetical protein [Spirochaetaceae bacterium]